MAVWECHAYERLAGDPQHLKNLRTKYSGLTIHSEFVSVSVFALWPLKYAENLVLCDIEDSILKLFDCAAKPQVDETCATVTSLRALFDCCKIKLDSFFIIWYKMWCMFELAIKARSNMLLGIALAWYPAPYNFRFGGAPGSSKSSCASLPSLKKK